MEHWNTIQIKTLRKLFPTTDNKIIAGKIGKTVGAVRARAVILGLKKKKHYWSEADGRYLIANYKYFTATQLGAKLNKSRWAIINKHRELLKRNNGKA